VNIFVDGMEVGDQIRTQIWLEDCGAARITNVESVEFKRRGARWYSADGFKLQCTATRNAERCLIRTHFGDLTIPVHCDPSRENRGVFLENGTLVYRLGTVELREANIWF
jgi:hypothetical protein